MIRVLYVVEAVLGIWVTAVGFVVGGWAWRTCVAVPLWLPAFAVGVGFVARLCREGSLVGWVAGWHGVLVRRVAER